MWQTVTVRPTDPALTLISLALCTHRLANRNNRSRDSELLITLPNTRPYPSPTSILVLVHPQRTSILSSIDYTQPIPSHFPDSHKVYREPKRPARSGFVTTVAVVHTRLQGYSEFRNVIPRVHTRKPRGSEEK